MKSFLSFLWEIIQIVVIALVLTLVLRYFIIEVREIPSSSMVPTINISERVLVDKIFYKITGNKANKGIKHSDILVFEPPENAIDPGQPKEDFIKRVIGLPGDTVEVRPDDGVYVNGRKLDEPYVNEIARSGIEPDSFDNSSLIKSSNNSIAVKVPQNSLFMMGDNRNNSKDSRAWGFASIDKVKGKAFLKIWPLSKFGRLK